MSLRLVISVRGGTTFTRQLLFLNLTFYLPWTKYVFNYTAPNVDSAKLVFALENDPDFWYLDDVSVKNSSGIQLLSNGDFETGDLTGWIYCNPKNASNSGTVSTDNPNTGWYSYGDGSVGSSDYLSQSFAVRANRTYSVAFWLQSISTNGTFASIYITA